MAELLESTPASEPRHHALIAESTPGLVLIVEDEPELVDPLEYSLKKAGFETLVALDGLAACRLTGEHKPDLVLLDIMLPDLDGWEVCKMIRSHPDETMASTPVLMMTALHSGHDRLRGLELGADAYLPKPYSMREVLVRARNLVERRRRHMELFAQIEQYRSHQSLAQDVQNMLYHELRNQLLIIGGFSNLLARGEVASVNEQSRSYLNAIHRSTSYLSLLAEEFLLMQKLEKGTVELPRQLINPEEIVQEVVELFAPAAQERKIGLEIASAGELKSSYLSAVALKMVLSNLVDNAIRYSGAGSSVILSCFQQAHQGLMVEVSDNGAGIAEADQEHIFDRFVRGRTASTEAGGSGLGLYIVRTLVEAMGGAVSLRSRPGNGTIFRLSFAEAPQRAALAKAGNQEQI